MYCLEFKGIKKNEEEIGLDDIILDEKLEDEIE